MKSKIEIVKLLLEYGAKVDQTHKEGFTPLLTAVWNDHPDMVKILLEYGADVNNTGNASITALLSAMSGDDIDIVKILLRHGADVNKPAKSGEAPIIYAEMSKKEHFANMLIECGAKIPEILYHKYEPRKNYTHENCINYLDSLERNVTGEDGVIGEIVKF